MLSLMTNNNTCHADTEGDIFLFEEDVLGCNYNLTDFQLISNSHINNDEYESLSSPSSHFHHSNNNSFTTEISDPLLLQESGNEFTDFDAFLNSDLFRPQQAQQQPDNNEQENRGVSYNEQENVVTMSPSEFSIPPYFPQLYYYHNHKIILNNLEEMNLLTSIINNTQPLIPVPFSTQLSTKANNKISKIVKQRRKKASSGKSLKKIVIEDPAQYLALSQQLENMSPLFSQQHNSKSIQVAPVTAEIKKRARGRPRKNKQVLVQ